MPSTAFNDQLTDEARDAILAAVRAGGYLAAACRDQGVSYQAAKYWRRRRSKRPRLVPKRIAAFLAELDAIDAAIEAELAAKVRARGRGWRGALWQLERRFPLRWRADRRRAAAATPADPSAFA